MYRPLSILIAALVFFAPFRGHADTPILQSWNDGVTKSAIVNFVDLATSPGPGFVPVDQRIAVFDNDGTLWCEQPYYAELFFTLDQIKAMAPQHPEWKTLEPFKSAIAGDVKGVMASGQIAELLTATHTGMTTEEFSTTVVRWVKNAKHPRFNRPFKDMTYLPMHELMDYLRDHGFKTYIVSGGGVEFMRPWTAMAYGIPPEQVIGSSGSEKFETKDGHAVITKLAKPDFIDDGAGKPVGIQKFIGRRPVMAFGNSDGDLQMLQWTADGPGPRFMALVHHTDADREYAYDRNSHIGKLDKALGEAKEHKWSIIDMKSDWKQIFAPDTMVTKKTNSSPAKGD